MKALSLMRRFGKRCHWCKRRVRLAGPNVHHAHRDCATVDHVKCKAETVTRAAYNARENKVLACYKCNNERNTAFIRKYPDPVPADHWSKQP